MMAYSTLPSSTALLTFIPKPNSYRPFSELLKEHSPDVLPSLLNNAYRNSNLVLLHYLQLSGIKLRKLPKKVVVDPLHFSLISQEYWKEPTHCRILSVALMLINDAWLLIAHNKVGVPAHVKEQYSR